MTRIATRGCAVVLATAALMTGCGPKETAEPKEGLTLQDARGAEYTSEWFESGRVGLSDGEYVDADRRLRIRLTDHYAFGDLDGDGSDDVAVVLVTDPGGSGTFFDLAVLSERGGDPINVASTALGDRVDLRSLTVENGRITADMVTHGPNDPMCCPSLRQVVAYQLRGNALVEVSRETVEGEPPEGRDLAVSGEFKALGNEPFWNVEIGATIAFSRLGEDPILFPYSPPQRTRARYVYSATIVDPAVHSIEIVIEREACIDSMSGARFDYRAIVSFDGRQYRGCAKAGSQVPR